MKNFSGAKRTKAVLVLNPAQPCINMQTTVRADVKEPKIEKLKVEIEKMVKKQCSRCGFEFDEGIYLMRNQTDYICVFCLRSEVDVTNLIDNQKLQVIRELLDREGYIQLFADLL